MGFLWGILCVISIFAGWMIAAERQGNGTGCMWAVLLVILFPLSPILVFLYYIFGKDNDDR